MSSNDEIKTKDIKSLPNSIDGNGSTFIDKLKKVLINFGYSIADNASTAANVSQVTELTLTETKNNSTKNIYVQFNKDGVKKFKEARIWVRTSAVATFTLDGVTTTGEYTKSGVSDSTTYYVKVVAVDTNDNVAEFSTAPVASITISAGSSSNPNPPTNLVVTWQGDVPTWSWRASSTPGNSSCFYELRTDNNPGSATNRFATVWWQSGTDIYTSNGVPTTNVGTVYCYFRNEYGLYSVPLKKDFAFPSAVRPKPPRFEQVDGGFLILIDDFPPTYSTASIEVIYNDGTTQTYQSSTTTKQIFGVSGRYKVRYKFNGATSEYDTEWSEYQEFELDRNPDIQEIDGSKIINGTVVGTKLYTGNVDANRIQSGSIATNAITADKVKAGELVITTGGTGDKVTIQDGAIGAGKLVANSIKAGQIDAGNIWAAVVAAGAVSATKITADNIAANTITGNKLKAETISLGNGLGVSGGGVLLNENGMAITKTNGGVIEYNQGGIVYRDGGITYASISRYMVGTANNNQRVTFFHPWETVPSVVVVPGIVQTVVAGYSTSNVEVVCSVTNVTVNGFDVHCYTKLKSGSSGTLPINETLVALTGDSSTDYTYTISQRLQGATRFAVQLSYSVSGYFDSSGCWGRTYCGYVRARLLINGAVVETVSSDSTASTLSATVTTNTYDFTASDTIQLQIYGNSQNSRTGASLTFVAMEFNVNNEVVISEGSCAWIATDANNNFYVTEDIVGNA